jgi:hypothetical protein
VQVAQHLGQRRGNTHEAGAAKADDPDLVSGNHVADLGGFLGRYPSLQTDAHETFAFEADPDLHAVRLRVDAAPGLVARQLDHVRETE